MSIHLDACVAPEGLCEEEGHGDGGRGGGGGGAHLIDLMCLFVFEFDGLVDC